MKKLAIDLIIFDFDGTLVDSQPVIVDAVNRVLEKLSFPPRSEAEIVSFIGYGVKSLLVQSLCQHTEEEYDKAYELYWEEYANGMVGEGKLFPGVIEVLEHFRDKKKVVMSNSLDPVVKEVLKEQKIDEFFEAVEGGSDETCLKPSSCSVDRFLKMFEVKKEKCLMVGDMVVDMEAGKNAGVHTCAVTYGIGRKEDILEAGPEHVIDNIVELKQIMV